MFTSVAASLLMALAVLAQEGPRIETPASVVQCQPSRLSWTGGSPPYWVTVIPAGQTAAAPIMTLKDNTQDTSMTWNVNLEPGTQVSLQIRDGTGAVQYSSPITVQAGSSTDCMNASPSGTDSAGAVPGASGGPTNAAGSGSASGAASPSASGAASPSAAGPSSAASPVASAPAGQSSAARPSSSAGAASSGAAPSGSGASAAVSSPAASPTSGASAVNIPVVGAAAVAAAIMAYV